MIICTLIVAGPAAAADKVVLMLAWYAYGEHAPFYYGKEKGIFAAEGVDLEIQEGRGSGPAAQAVAAKSVDFGYADVPTMMRATVKGEVIATGVLLQTSPMSAMGFAEKNVRKPEDIKGKTVATTRGSAPDQIWPLFLKKTGLKESDFKTVLGDATAKVNAVINGQADLLLGVVMDQGMVIKAATGKNVYPITFADYGINLVSSGIIANQDLVKNKPDLVRRMMAASTKAILQRFPVVLNRSSLPAVSSPRKRGSSTPQHRGYWIPAFAGMTAESWWEECLFHSTGNRSRPSRRGARSKR